MDELDHNLLAAWFRVFEKCRADPAEARRRYERMRAGGMFDRPVRAWCVALRASDSRLTPEGGGDGESGVGGESQELKRWMWGMERSGLSSGAIDEAIRAQVAHEIVVDGEVMRRLGGPVRIEYPGVPLAEAAKLLGRDYAGMRRWLPVGAGRSRVERDALARRGQTVDGRLSWATFEDRGYALKVRYEPAGRHGQRGREVPVVWSDRSLDPGGAKGMPPARWWGSLWTGLAAKIPAEYVQVLERVPKVLPVKGAMRFRGWLWKCPGLMQAVGSRQSGVGKRQGDSEPRCANADDLPGNFPGNFRVRGCGRLVPKLFAPLPVWTIGKYLDVKEGLAVEGLDERWLPGVTDRWAGRRGLACRECWGVRNGGSAERHGWNEFVTAMSGGLLYGHEVQKPSGFEYERRRPRPRKSSRRKSSQRKEGKEAAALERAAVRLIQTSTR